MISIRTTLAVVFSVMLMVSPAFVSAASHRVVKHHTRVHHTSYRHHYSRRHHYRHYRHYRRRSRWHRVHGQQSITPKRVTQIQEALIREHYLNKKADGKWDATTIAAMRKFQADNGWQTRLVPDSRALEKLGLGPNYSNAINASSLASKPPAPSETISSSLEADFAAAAGVSQ